MGATGDADTCRTWPASRPAPDALQGTGGDIETLGTMKTLGVPTAWDEPRPADVCCSKAWCKRQLRLHDLEQREDIDDRISNEARRSDLLPGSRGHVQCIAWLLSVELDPDGSRPWVGQYTGESDVQFQSSTRPCVYRHI